MPYSSGDTLVPCRTRVYTTHAFYTLRHVRLLRAIIDINKANAVQERLSVSLLTRGTELVTYATALAGCTMIGVQEAHPRGLCVPPHTPQTG